MNYREQILNHLLDNKVEQPNALANIPHNSQSFNNILWNYYLKFDKLSKYYNHPSDYYQSYLDKYEIVKNTL